jgi:hypothetical protein
MQHQAPYGGDALNYSCSDQDAFHPHYLPFAPALDGQYLAVPPGGLPTRYVLANVPPYNAAKNLTPPPGNPTDFSPPEDPQMPPTAPQGVLTQLFMPLPQARWSLPTNLAALHLGLFKPDTYEHTLTLSSGSTVTCRNHLPPYRALAATAYGPGAANVFYFTHDSHLTNLWSVGGRWNGPGPLPGTPDTSAGLAAVPDNVFFVQNGRLVVDTYTNGWQNPVQLPGTPKGGSPLAVTFNGPNDIHVYFDSNNGFANDWWDGAKWNGPGPMPGSPDDGSGFVAVEDIPGQSMHVFFVQGGQLTNDWWTPQQGWQGPAGLPGPPDGGTPIAAVSGTAHDMHVFFVHGGLLNNIWYDPQSGWQGPAGLPTTPDAGTGLAAVVVQPGDTDIYAMSGGALVVDYWNNGWQQAPFLYPR